MNVRKARTLRNLLLILGAVFALLSRAETVFAFIGLVIVFSSLIPELLWNRCPHCGKHLWRNDGDYCQYCGGSIDG